MMIILQLYTNKALFRTDLYPSYSKGVCNPLKLAWADFFLSSAANQFTVTNVNIVLLIETCMITSRMLFFA